MLLFAFNCENRKRQQLNNFSLQQFPGQAKCYVCINIKQNEAFSVSQNLQ